MSVLINPFSDDVLDQPDTVSLTDLEPVEQSQMDRAGIDPLTAVDAFMAMNGDTVYVEEI